MATYKTQDIRPMLKCNDAGWHFIKKHNKKRTATPRDTYSSFNQQQQENVENAFS